jgi:4-hydroxy-3-methylbut-2-enyl diphosphate reductase
VDLVLVIGSRNSSNSQRLVETAHQAGKAAYLIDDQTELDPAWFEGVKTVLITAGASAPEHLVQDLVRRLEREHGAESQVRTVAEEDISFSPPKSLRSLTVVA